MDKKVNAHYKTVNIILTNHYTFFISIIMSEIIKITPCFNYKDILCLSLFSEYGVSSNELMNYLSISFNTLKKYLNEIPKDILIKQTQSRNIYYQFNLDNLNIFLNNTL